MARRYTIFGPSRRVVIGLYILAAALGIAIGLLT